MSEKIIVDYDVIVVGTGAAGYQAACRLTRDGRKKTAMVTEGVRRGTSRNTGSDKQTYYKLGLGGSAADSVRQMAADLFAGGSVDGDNALCEAALSARCFLNLCELGVPFPVNRYGEYVGYKTDHDPYARATSAGPLTSKFMTEALEKQAAALQIPIYDGLLAVEILKSGGEVCGLLCVDTKTGETVCFRCTDVVLATGGPAGIYADSVYPESQCGSSGLALAAGAAMQNLTEWQFGLASVAPRWNVSGTYMQVLPRLVSRDETGQEREFLLEYFSDPYKALSMLFLKGYQWPFDSWKALHGSSVIDLLVYRETVLRHRRVYLDYRTNPFGLETLDFSRLSPEAADYLRRADACFGTPLARLERMNHPAVELYRSKGVCLEAEMLEIALCAQHHNGGISVDHWWRTRVPGLFAAGECAGTHGVTRPGGSALNAGQVGALRAAQRISAETRQPMAEDAFRAVASAAEKRLEARFPVGPGADCAVRLAAARRRMSDCGGAIRDDARMKQALAELLAELEVPIAIPGPAERALACRLYDTLLVQAAVLTAMTDFGDTADGTRGSALYTDSRGELAPGMPELFRFRQESGASRNQIQQVTRTDRGFCVIWRPVRPIPPEDDVFETVWRRYRENGNVE